MAYQAKDGKPFTNRPPMMQHNKSLDAKQDLTQKVDPLAQPAGDEQQPEEQGVQGPEHLAQLFSKFMDEEAQEGEHDPKECKALADYFGKFIQQETEEPEHQEPEQEYE